MVFGIYLGFVWNSDLDAWDLSSFERFYELAEARNGAMFSNLLAGVAAHQSKAAVLIAGGFSRTPFRPEVEPFQFAPHVKIPVLMINGRYDAINEYADRQVTLFEHLGTEDLKKELVSLESGHIPPVDETVQAVDDWLRTTFAGSHDGPHE